MDDDLYNDTIMDLGQCSEHRGELPAPAYRAAAYNPVCGDDVKIFALITRQGIVESVKWHTDEGTCIISAASATMLADSLIGKTVEDARNSLDRFRSFIRGSVDGDPNELGDLASFACLQRNPRRVKCAAMAWAAFDDILETHAGGQ